MRVVVWRGVGHMDGGVRNTIMSIRADTHLFGSKQGYCTLAHSAGVVHAESDELSAFGFGQTGSSAYLDTLVTEPSAYGRQLRSGRVGITRCLKGCPDDAGRPTLLLCTLLLAPQDYEGLVQRGLDSVINDPSIWELACFESGEQIAIRPTTTGPPRSVQKDDLGVLDAWLTSQLNRGSVSALSHERKTAETVLALPQVLEASDRLRYRWGVNLLSGDAPVDVCTLSTSAKQSGRRKINRFEPDGPIRNEVVGGLRDSLDAGTLRELSSLASMLNPVPESSALPHKPLVLNQEADIQMPLQPSHRRRVITAAAISFAGVAVVASVLALGTGIFRKYQDARDEHTAQIDGAVAMDTSTREQDKQEERLASTTVKTKSPPANIKGGNPPPDATKSLNESGNQTGSEENETSPRGINKENDPSTDTSNSSIESGDQAGIKNPETSLPGDSKENNPPPPEPDEFQAKENNTPQADKARGIVHESANKPTEKDDDTPGPTPSNPEPDFKSMSDDKIADWFDNNELPKPDKGDGTQPFDEQYGQEALLHYVAALKEIRKRVENVGKPMERFRSEEETLGKLCRTRDNAAENIRQYIGYLKQAYGKSARAPSSDPKEWHSISALRKRLKINEALMENANLCLNCMRHMEHSVRKIANRELVDPEKIARVLRDKLAKNKVTLEKRIERLRIDQRKPSIKLGSDNG